MKSNLQHIDVNKIQHDSNYELDKLSQELKKAKQTIRNMKNVLWDIEWIEEVLNPNACPWCSEMKQKGHDRSCRLKKVLEK